MNEQRKATPPKVIHFIWWIPHYRVPIFRRLSQNTNIDFVVCAGNNTNIGGGNKIASAHDVGKIKGVNWKKLESRRIKGPLFNDFEWQPEAIKIVWKEEIDVVISFGYQSLSNLLVRLICKLRSIPVVEWTQGVKREESGFRWFIRKMYFKWAKAFLLYGEFARDFFASHGFKEEQLFVVHNSLDYDVQRSLREKITPKEIHQYRAEIGIRSEKGRLVFNSSRLEQSKKIDILIRAMSELKQKDLEVYLILIGDGREKHSLQNLCRECKVEDRVVFYGACFDEEKLGIIISASDLCVVPGEVGLIAMHSLVYGTPILACDNRRGMHGPEIETVIERKTGIFFNDGDVHNLVEKMEQMLYPKPSKNEMSRNCMKMIDQYYTPQYQERVIIQSLNYVLPAEKQIPLPE